MYKNCYECQNKNKKNNFCTQHVLRLEFSCTELVNNLLSYCGLVDATISASDKDLPVLPPGLDIFIAIYLIVFFVLFEI